MDITVRNKNNWSGEGIYVGRGSPLGNPYKLTNEEDRSIVIERYGAMLKRAIQKRDPHIISALHNIEAYLQEHGKCNLVRRMIDDYKPPLKPLKEYDIYGLDEIHEPKQLTDIGELAKEIRSKADKIRHSHNRNEMRRKGHEIVKLAKRIINLQEK
jgi:hypothetical protein